MKRILLFVLCAFLMGCATNSGYATLSSLGLLLNSRPPINSNKPFDDKELEKRVDEITYERLRDGWRDAGYSEEEIEKMLKKYKRKQDWGWLVP